MVTHKTLVLAFEVRILVTQLNPRHLCPAGIMGASVGAEDLLQSGKWLSVLVSITAHLLTRLKPKVLVVGRVEYMDGYPILPVSRMALARDWRLLARVEVSS